MFWALTLDERMAQRYDRQLQQEAAIERSLKVDGLRTVSLWLWVVATLSHLILVRRA